MLVDIGDPVVLDLGDLGVVAVDLGDQLGGDLTLGGDHHLTDGVEVFAGLGQDNGVARGVLHFLHGDSGVGMAVDQGVQAGGIGNDFLGSPDDIRTTV